MGACLSRSAASRADGSASVVQAVLEAARSVYGSVDVTRFLV